MVTAEQEAPGNSKIALEVSAGNLEGLSKTVERRCYIFLFSLLNSEIKIEFAFAWVGNESKIKTARGNNILGSGSYPASDIEGKKLGKMPLWKQSVKAPPTLEFDFLKSS